jgi:glycosyltransferase involved in cell wall biosynthesis
MLPSSGYRTLVVLPAWNEQEALPGVLAELAAVGHDADVLVVNDGSLDATADVARAHGADVLDLALNLGVGGAMRAGFKYALRHGYDVVVQLDADGQHDPREIATLVDTLASQDADIAIGARFAGRGTYTARGLRRGAMKMFAVVISRVARTPLTDTTSGFKAMGPRAVRLFATNYPAEYLGDTIEALVIAARSGLRIVQVGVEMRERQGGAPSHSPVKSAIFLVRATVALVMALLRPREPLAEVAS